MQGPVTVIYMRIILSQDKVSIFNLAKNAGTSVEQIERFYARNLPLSPELAKNLNHAFIVVERIYLRPPWL
jgi:hypothetical protein